MRRHRTTDEEIAWQTVGQRRPCPVCGATGGCGVAEDGRLVVCRWTRSGLPVQGGGWLHVLPAPIPFPRGDGDAADVTRLGANRAGPEWP
jgi:hypothetical protein